MREVENYKVDPIHAFLAEDPKYIFISSLFCLIWAKGFKLHFFPEDATNRCQEIGSLKSCFYPINTSYMGNKYKVEQ